MPAQVFPAAAAGAPRGQPDPVLVQMSLDGDEHGELFGVNIHPTVAVTLVVHVRLVSAADRRTKAIEHRLVLAPDDALGQFALLERGAIQSVIVYVESDAGISLGDVFASFRLVRGSQSTFVYGATLVQGYVTSRNSLAWPGSPIQDLHSGRGVVRVYPLTNAAVAAVALIPANRRARIVGGRAVLTTSGVGVARFPYVEIQQGGSIVWQQAGAAAQGLGALFNYNIVPGALDYPVPPSFSRVLMIPPDVELRGGDQLSIGALNAELTDAWSGGSLLVREWYEPQ